MSYSPKDFEALAKRMRMNLTALQGQLSDLMRMLSSLPFSEPRQQYATCPRCGAPLKPATKERLDEHLENVHRQVPA